MVLRINLKEKKLHLPVVADVLFPTEGPDGGQVGMRSTQVDGPEACGERTRIIGQMLQTENTQINFQMNCQKQYKIKT